MKILIYCQHVLGLGHFFRTLELCRGLSAHHVTLVLGGPPVDVPIPSNVKTVHLPSLQMSEEFKALHHGPADADDLEDIRNARGDQLMALFREARPDVFVVELYPFGRKAFRFEIDPVLEAIQDGALPKIPVLCSLRDILVEKEDRERHESRALNILNRYFSALLVHADPELVRLEETFSMFDDIAVPVHYTGFVAPSPDPDARERIRGQLGIGEADVLIVASAGGGKVGAPLLESVVPAVAAMDGVRKLFLRVYTGPYYPEESGVRLKQMEGDRVRIIDFEPDFLSHLAAADLSMSMAGYNTVMNILAARVPSLVWPFPQNREQRTRAGKLASLGVLGVLDKEELTPEGLARRMQEALSGKPPKTAPVNMDGARTSAAWVEKYGREAL